LATPIRDPQLEFETLLRLLFADQTDNATLDRWLDETAERARQMLDDGIERLLRPYVTDDGGPFPARRHIAALVAAFVADYLRLIERWSEFARDEIRQWPRTDGLGMTDRTREILDTVLEGKSVLDPGPLTSLPLPDRVPGTPAPGSRGRRRKASPSSGG
jgi:hypothetical protein